VKTFYTGQSKEVYKPLAPIFLDCGIKIFYLEEGDPCWQIAEKMALAISQIGTAAVFDPFVKHDMQSAMCLRAGITACQSLIFTDKWKKSNLAVISRALQEASDLEEVVEKTFLLTAQILRKDSR
jgi:hypothetical protein